LNLLTMTSNGQLRLDTPMETTSSQSSQNSQNSNKIMLPNHPYQPESYLSERSSSPNDKEDTEEIIDIQPPSPLDCQDLPNASGDEIHPQNTLNASASIQSPTRLIPAQPKSGMARIISHERETSISPVKGIFRSTQEVVEKMQPFPRRIVWKSPFNIAADRSRKSNGSISNQSESSESVDCSFDVLRGEVDALYLYAEEDAHRDIISEMDAYALPMVDAQKLLNENENKPIIQGEEQRNKVIKEEVQIANSQNEFKSVPGRCILQNFASEHRIFVRAMLSLLTERDKFAIDAANADDPQTIKVGTLKKASHLMKGVWKVKYVEIRRGLLSYYDDSGDRSKFEWNSGNNVSGPVSRDGLIENGGTSHNHKNQRKSYPLRASLCTCRAVKVHNKRESSSPRLPFQTGYIFELTVEGGPKRLWMANSREERQAWVQAIHNAMIGGSVTLGNSYVDYNFVEGDLGIPQKSPYKNDLEIYVSVQRELQQARTVEKYLIALECLCQRRLKVPVQWIKEQMKRKSRKNEVQNDIFGEANIGNGISQLWKEMKNRHNRNEYQNKAFEEGNMSVGITQMWKDMLRDSVKINGVVLEGDKGHGPERIIGALVQLILKFDKISMEEQNIMRQKTSKRGKMRHPIKEYEAVSIARDVLLSVNRTRSAGDSYYCVEKLCSNQNLVVLCPFSAKAEPLRITVSETSLNDRQFKSKQKDCKGWIKIRHKITKRWKKRYCILGEGGVLSFYEKEKPRPYGLRAQIIMLHAKMSISEMGGNKYIVTIESRDRSSEQQFCFENKKILLVWKEAFQKAIEGRLPPVFEDDIINEDSNTSNNIRHGSQGYEKQSSDDSNKEAITKNRDLQSSNIKRTKARRSNVSFYIKVEASTAYKICTTDPSGIDKEDTWATIKTNFQQSFRVRGSKLHRGEEIVGMHIFRG